MAEAGGCPHAKAAAAKAEGEGSFKGHGDCANCPMYKDGTCTCPHNKDGKGCACAKDGKGCDCAKDGKGCDCAKDGKGCDCTDCPRMKDGTCPHQAAIATPPAAATN
jgi:hypothetical protein